MLETLDARRETVAFERRPRKAKFPQQAVLEGFDFHASPKLPAAQIRDLAALRRLRACKSVILFGPVDVGKTRVARALGHLVIRRRGRGFRSDHQSRSQGRVSAAVQGHDMTDTDLPVFDASWDRFASWLSVHIARRFRLDHRANQRKIPAMWSPARYMVAVFCTARRCCTAHMPHGRRPVACPAAADDVVVRFACRGPFLRAPAACW
ncbi:ATP-binding protein [Streptomyces sp. NPDC002088]|uniref:ATP-binding protein n=1 Tax=Streptomyces sp. NPDC002088 TaxID=3154665 RepID=UPI00332FEC3A